MGVFLATIDASIVNVAMPTLERALQSSFSIVQWVILAYLLTITTLLLSAGRLADMVGKKPIYMIGIVVFTISSALCGLSATVYWLIGFRVIQAIGAAMIMALGPAIITEAFPGEERGKALGIIGSVVSVGIVIGPTLGGIIVDALSWHWIFFVNIPVGIAGILMVFKFLPNVRPPGGQRFDYPGAVTLFISLIGLLLALTMGQRFGFGSLPILSLFATWFLFLGIFLLLEWNVSQPMVDLKIFRTGSISINLVMAVLAFIAVNGTMFLMPFFLENVKHYTTSQVGLLLAVIPLTLGITSPISGVVSDRFGPRPVTVVGIVILVIAFYGLSTIDSETTTAGYILRFLPIGAGMGIFQSPNNSAIMGSAPHNQLGVVSGLLAISRLLGQTVGIATMGAMWASFVFLNMGTRLEGGATAAPLSAQVAGFHNTFLVTTGLVGIALLLSLWSVVHARSRATSVAHS